MGTCENRIFDDDDDDDDDDVGRKTVGRGDGRGEAKTGHGDERRYDDDDIGDDDDVGLTIAT